MKILTLLLIIISTLWITFLNVKLSAEKDKQTIGESYLIYWNEMASSPQWLCRARGGKYYLSGYSFDFRSRDSETSWQCIDDKH